jgi:tetratricopeptide (TPR) repeat protein
LIQVNISDKSSFHSSALEDYKLGVKKAKDKVDYRGAIKHYSNALSKDGSFAEAYVSRGRAYSELGDQQRAIADYTKAMSVKPKFAEDPDRYVEPLLGRGAVYIKLGNYQAALNDFNLAIKRNPDFYDAYLGRATIYIYIRQKDYQKAIEDLNEVLALTADDYPAAFFRRGSIRGELGEYEKRLKILMKLFRVRQKMLIITTLILTTNGDLLT